MYGACRGQRYHRAHPDLPRDTEGALASRITAVQQRLAMTAMLSGAVKALCLAAAVTSFCDPPMGKTPLPSPSVQESSAISADLATPSQMPPAEREQSKRRAREVDALVRQIRSLEPWSSMEYSRRGWKSLTKLARTIQRTDPGTVELALIKYMELTPEIVWRRLEKWKRQKQVVPYPHHDEESKPFLLLRPVFDLPEAALQSESFSFKGWNHYGLDRYHEASRQPPRDTINFTELDKDYGGVNLAWPITFRFGQPRLVDGNAGASGPPYFPSKEYRYMLERFKYRYLDTVGQSTGDRKRIEPSGSDRGKK
jgi:hypothetical protein